MQGGNRVAETRVHPRALLGSAKFGASQCACENRKFGGSMRLRVLLIALWAVLGCGGRLRHKIRPGCRSRRSRPWPGRRIAPAPMRRCFRMCRGFRSIPAGMPSCLGPNPRAEAAARLAALKREGMIPADSFLTDGGGQGQQFWPVGATRPRRPSPRRPPSPPGPRGRAAEPEETQRGQSQRKAALSDDDRMALQQAMAWYGFYDSDDRRCLWPGHAQVDAGLARGQRALSRQVC